MSPSLTRICKQYSHLICEASDMRDANRIATAERLEEQAAELERQIEAEGLNPADFVDREEWEREKARRGGKSAEPLTDAEWFERNQQAINRIVEGGNNL